MFDRYYCIKNKLRYMKIRNLWRKWTRKAILSAAKRPRKWHVHCVCFENATSRATSCWRHVVTFATVHATDADVTSYDGPGMHTFKAAKQVYNSTRIALLKHGFVLVKTWLLIACGTGFYAIMGHKNLKSTNQLVSSVVLYTWTAS